MKVTEDLSPSPEVQNASEIIHCTAAGSEESISNL